MTENELEMLKMSSFCVASSGMGPFIKEIKDLLGKKTLWTELP